MKTLVVYSHLSDVEIHGNLIHFPKEWSRNPCEFCDSHVEPDTKQELSLAEALIHPDECTRNRAKEMYD